MLALEPSHALSYAIELAKRMTRSETIVVTISARGERHVDVVQRDLKMEERKNVGNSEKNKQNEIDRK